MLPGGWMGSLTALLLRTLFDTTLAVNNVVVKLAAPAAVATLTCQSASVSTCRDGWRAALQVPWVYSPGFVAELTCQLAGVSTCQGGWRGTLQGLWVDYWF